jgi:hypothetical protein
MQVTSKLHDDQILAQLRQMPEVISAEHEVTYNLN